MTDGDLELCMQSDYTNMKEEAYKDVVLRYLEERGSLNLLASCNLAAEGSRNENLPTWAPNWEIRMSNLG